MTSLCYITSIHSPSSPSSRSSRSSRSSPSSMSTVVVLVLVRCSSSSLNQKVPSVGSRVWHSISILVVRGRISSVVRDSCPSVTDCPITRLVPCATQSLIDFEFSVGPKVRSPETVLSFIVDPCLSLCIARSACSTQSRIEGILAVCILSV